MIESKFNEQDSLKLINDMISQVKSNIQIGAADSMIRSGYTVIVISLINIILIYTLPNPFISFFAWTLMIPISIINYFIDKKKDKSAIVKTHIDRIIGKTWRAFGWSVWVFLAILFAMVYIMDTWLFCLLIMPVILTLTGLAQYVTATATKYNPFLRGAYVFWAGAILCAILLFVAKEHYAAGQFVILSICMVVGFCIPGHVLNNKAKV